MNIYVVYAIIALLMIGAELLYFKIADKYNIIDKPNERSSHSSIVLRGGGIIFLIAVWLWSAFNGFQYPWFLVAVTLAAGVSFVDDIKSLPDSVRLVVQFTAMGMMFQQLDILYLNMWWIVILALIVCVGASNVINFMDGINGITAGYSMAVIVPLLIVNRKIPFIEESFLGVILIAILIFSFFNFRERGKAKCFAGDVGSVGIAFILLFAIGKLVLITGDVTWLALLLVYGVDGCLTIIHRIMLHENLGQAHRKHIYQLMANELKMSHVKVSLIYMILQMGVSLCMIYLVPDSVCAHWGYMVFAIVILSLVYILFKKKYYHLHEEYLKSLEKTNN